MEGEDKVKNCETPGETEKQKISIKHGILDCILEQKEDKMERLVKSEQSPACSSEQGWFLSFDRCIKIM